MKQHREKAAVAAACILMATAGVTVAYLTDTDHADNPIDTSSVAIRTVEDFTPPDDPKPGTVVRKAPRVHSDSDVACYVRMRVDFTNDGQTFCDALKINSGWELKQDGYYYWSGQLLPGADTGTLFDQVSIRSDIDREDLESFDILVYSEAVQAGDRSAQEAWKTMDE